MKPNIDNKKARFAFTLIIVSTCVMKLFHFAYSKELPMASDYSFFDVAADVIWSMIIIAITAYLSRRKLGRVGSRHVLLTLIILLIAILPFICMAVFELFGIQTYLIVGGLYYWCPLGMSSIIIDTKIIGFLLAMFTPFVIDKLKNYNCIIEVAILNISICAYSGLSKTMKPGFIWSLALMVSIWLLIVNNSRKMLYLGISAFAIIVNYFQLRLEWTAADTTVLAIFRRLTSISPVIDELGWYLGLLMLLTIIIAAMLVVIGLANKTISLPSVTSISFALLIMIINVVGYLGVVPTDFGNIFPFGRYSGTFYYIWLTYVCITVFTSNERKDFADE